MTATAAGTKRGSNALPGSQWTEQMRPGGSPGVRKEKMATDYDAPRRNESDEPSEDSLEELKARRNEAQSAVVDIDEGDTAESFELPGADLSGEELTVKVIPKQADEFTCSVCFLVQHRSRLAADNGGRLVCVDCA